MMKNLQALILLTSLLYTSCESKDPPAAIQSDSSSLSQAQQEIILSYINPTPEETQFAVALIEGDSVAYAGVYKTQNDVQWITNQDNIFEIGSITKVFTAGILAKLSADRLINLNDPIQKHLPVTLQQNGSNGTEVTLLHLANHTSGLPRLPDNLLGDPSIDMSNPYKNYGQQQLYVYLKDQVQLASIPGKQYAYSNLGFGLLGHILSLTAEQSYEDLLRETITMPLDMTHTYINLPASLESQLVEGRDAEGNITANWNFDVIAGAGAIKSSVSDMAVFLRANMHENLPTYTSWQQCQNPTFSINEELSIGLGWHISKNKHGLVYWHNGGTGGYRTCVAFDPEQQRGVVVLSNVSAFSQHEANIDQLCFNLLNSMMD